CLPMPALASADLAALRAQLFRAQGLIVAGQADHALPELAGALAAAKDGGLAAEEATAGVLWARALARTGAVRPALAKLAAAMARARAAGDPRLALSVAREGAGLARRLDAPVQADLYVQLAQQEAARVRELE